MYGVVPNVADVPDCKQFQKRSYETARGETVNVTCEVNSFPPPKTFIWALNSTGEEFPVHYFLRIPVRIFCLVVSLILLCVKDSY